MNETKLNLIKSDDDKYFGKIGENIYPLEKEDYEILSETCMNSFDSQTTDFYKRLKDLEDNYKQGCFLTKEEDIYLGKIIYSMNLMKQMGNDSLEFDFLEKKAQKAIFLLVQYNLALAIKMANSYLNMGLDREDLIQEGTIKLMTAARKYDYRKDVKFSTYATYWVKQGIREALHSQSKTIRRPTHIITILNKINMSKEKLSRELKRAPTEEELSLETGISIENIIQYSIYSQESVSFQATNSSEDYTFESLLASDLNVEEMICDKTVKEAIEKALNTLTERECEVITLRYGLSGMEPMTLDKIGIRLGITRERVRQIESKALRHLRHPSRSKFLKDYV